MRAPSTVWTMSTPRYIRARIKSALPAAADADTTAATPSRTDADAAAASDDSSDHDVTVTSWRLYVEDGWVDGRTMYEECGADAKW